MQQGLMLCCGSSRGRDCRHRLDTLALQRHEQPETIISKRNDPVRVTDHLDEAVDVGREGGFILLRPRIHLTSPRSSPINDATSI